jgi:hypothetical protein
VDETGVTATHSLAFVVWGTAVVIRVRSIPLCAALHAVAVVTACRPADDDFDFTGTDPGDDGDDDGSSGGPTTGDDDDADASTAADGCQSDDDCVDDPSGPACDAATGTCFGECVPGTTRECYSGPDGTAGMGTCVAGTQMCEPDATWGVYCDGEIVPASDDCDGNDADDDCDGLVDDSDFDGDGFGRCTADCCDVDGGGCDGAALVNPGAFEVVDNGVDDDCDGDTDEASPTCDEDLLSASSDADDYARAIDLCQFTVEDPADPLERTWGVIDAGFSRADGNDSPLPVQRSLRTDFGAVIDPEAGATLAVLSSGHAADATDTNPGFAPFQAGQDLGTTSPAPADWLMANDDVFPNPAGCLEPWDTLAHDPIMLTLRIRVPTNARSFSVKMQFFSAEYPEWVCSEFNDFFVALVDSTSTENPADKNIAIYDDGVTAWPVGVNLVMIAEGLFTQCQNGIVGCARDLGADYEGCLGTALLEGTGFDAPDDACDPGQDQVGGGTGWLEMSGNVTPGEVMELRLAIWDTSGHIFDSLVLLDDWHWSLDAATPGVAPG